MSIIGQIYKVGAFGNRMYMYIISEQGITYKIAVEYYNRVYVEVPNLAFSSDANGNLHVSNNRLHIDQAVQKFVRKASDRILKWQVVDKYMMNGFSDTPTKFIECYINCTPRSLDMFIHKKENSDISCYKLYEHDIGIDVKFFSEYNLEYSGVYEFPNAMAFNIINLPEKTKMNDIPFYDPKLIRKPDVVPMIYPKIAYYDIETYTTTDASFPLMTKVSDVVSIISLIIEQGPYVEKHCFCLCPNVSNMQDMTNFTQYQTKYKELVDQGNQITYGQSVMDFHLHTYEHEREMLIAFMNFLKVSRLNVITGYNIFSYDNKYIAFRCVMHGIDVSTDIVYKRTTGNYIFNLNGVLCVDILKFVKAHIPLTELNNHKLKEVCKHLGLDNGKIEMAYETVFQSYRNICEKPMDPVARQTYMDVIEYCIRDSEVLSGINKKLDMWLTFTSFSNIHFAGIDIIANEGSVRKLTNLIYHWMNKFGYIFVPNSGTKIKYEGGYVHLSSPGFHKNIAVVDFASLYPSLIISNNLCPTTIVPYGTETPQDSKVHTIEYDKEVQGDDDGKKKHDEIDDADDDMATDDDDEEEGIINDETMPKVTDPDDDDTPTMKKIKLEMIEIEKKGESISHTGDQILWNQLNSQWMDLLNRLTKLKTAREKKPKKEKQVKEVVKEFFKDDQKITLKKETKQVAVVNKSTRLGVYPQLLTYLLKRRKEVKKEMEKKENEYLEYKTSENPDPLIVIQKKFEFDEKEKLQLALKITANSLYGICCARGAISCMEVGVITTMLGRTAIKNVNNHLSDKGYPHIYSDTDSSMVNIGDCTQATTLDDVKTLFPTLHEQQFPKKLALPLALNKFQSVVNYMNESHLYYDDPMNLEFETYALFGVWLKKKFYVCIYKNEKNEDKYKTRGTVDRRSDKPQILKDLFKKLYIQILANHKIEESMELIYQVVSKIKQQDISMFEISKGYRGIDKYANPDTTPMVRFVLNAERFGIQIEAGSRARYIMSNECYAAPNEEDAEDFASWVRKLQTPSERDIKKLFEKTPGHCKLKKMVVDYYPQFRHLYKTVTNEPSIPCANSSPYSADYWAVKEMNPSVDYMKYLKFMESQIITMMTKAYPCIIEGVYYDVTNKLVITKYWCHNCLIAWCNNQNQHNLQLIDCETCERRTKCGKCGICTNCYCDTLRCQQCAKPSANYFEIISMFKNIELIEGNINA